MSDVMTEYFAALERLKDGSPVRVPRGTKISNDSVALEAGRGKGSIKKSRPVFHPLIGQISAAGAEQRLSEGQSDRQIDRARAQAREYREKWEQALFRELSLLQELYSLKKELVALRGGDVLPLRPPR